jgi:hypothetical protein
MMVRLTAVIIVGVISLCGYVAAEVPQSVVQRAQQLAGQHQHLCAIDREKTLFTLAVNEIRRAAPFAHRQYGWVEMFSGTGGATRAVANSNVHTATFDRTDHPSEDICWLAGLIYIGLLVLSLNIDGVLWVAPQCSAWLNFISVNWSKRNRAGYGIKGDDTQTGVREANVTGDVVRGA